MGFLKLIGAVSAAEHSKAISQRDETYLKERARLIDERDAANRKAIDFEAKFKRAVKDMAAQADELTAHKDGIAVLKEMTAQDAETIAALRPDAEAMRKKRQDDSDRAQAKRDAAKSGKAQPAPKAKAAAKKAVRK